MAWCLAQAALLVPQYVLAEITLSFLGLGVGEPAASLGNLLGELQQVSRHLLVLVDVPSRYRVDTYLLFLLCDGERAATQTKIHRSLKGAAHV